MISQASCGGEIALETFKYFAEWTGLKHLGTVVASVGAQTVKEFPEYIEEAKILGEKNRKRSCEKVKHLNHKG